MRSPTVAALFALWAIACASSTRNGTAVVQHPPARPFQLTIVIERTDSRLSAVSDGTQVVKSESETTLFGRAEFQPTGGAVTFYADSIRHHSREPFEFHTFMSADTMYYLAGGRGGEIDHRRAEYDSMLWCVFVGPVLRIDRDESGLPGATIQLKGDCRSGEYERINAPVTLSAFLMRTATDHDRWHERRPLPSYSGVGFHPEIDLLYRTVRATQREATVTIAADTTIENLSTRMKNGEEVVVVRQRIRLGGTMTVDRSTGFAARGELRIGESLRMARPHASGMIVLREGLYRIRFSLP
jgi:hypothetical protein